MQKYNKFIVSLQANTHFCLNGLHFIKIPLNAWYNKNICDNNYHLLDMMIVRVRLKIYISPEHDGNWYWYYQLSNLLASDVFFTRRC